MGQLLKKFTRADDTYDERRSQIVTDLIAEILIAAYR